MARKKTVSDDPELQDYNMEESPQYLEGEAPVEGTQDTALDSGTPPDSDVPPDGDFPSFPEDAPPFEMQAADDAAEDNPPEPERPIPEEDYGAILQEMGCTAPVEDAPLMLDTDTSQETPTVKAAGQTRQKTSQPLARELPARPLSDIQCPP